MPISTLRAWEAAQEADEQLAAEQERREELERGYRRLEAHATMLETQVSELRELNERQERHDMIFTAIVVGICLLILLFANCGCAPAEAEESEAASVPPVIVDASDQKAQERRSHEVEAVEAGKLDSDGNPIDGEKAIVARLREFAQQRRDEAAANAAESAPEAEQAPDYYETEYVDESAYIAPYTPSQSDNGDGFVSQGVRDYNGTKETWYSSNILYHYRTPEWTPDSEGYYRDADGYYVVASTDHGQGEVIDTSKGEAKVYDTGCASGVTDFYTNF